MDHSPQCTDRRLATDRRPDELSTSRIKDLQWLGNVKMDHKCCLAVRTVATRRVGSPDLPPSTKEKQVAKQQQQQQQQSSTSAIVAYFPLSRVEVSQGPGVIIDTLR